MSIRISRFRIDMGANLIKNLGTATSSTDAVNKQYIDDKFAMIKEKRVAQFTASGNWTVPAGVTYAIAYIRGAGGGGGTSTVGGDGGNSSIAFTAGTITANGGKGFQVLYSGPTSAIGAVNSGQGSFQNFGSDGGPYRQVSSVVGSAGAEIVAGGVVTPAQVIAIVVGVGGTAGGSGAVGGSGYVWIEYWVAP